MMKRFTLLVLAFCFAIPAIAATPLPIQAVTFGAKCDNATDDASAIAKAIAATPEGGTLQLPMGKCKVGSTLTISKSINLQGSGPGRGMNPTFAGSQPGTELVSTCTGCNVISVAPSGSNRITGLELRDLSIKGNRDVGGATAGIGISIDSGSGSIETFIIQNVVVWRAFGDGIYINGTVFAGTLLNVVSSENGANGFNLNGTSVNQLELLRATAVSNVVDGFHLAGGGNSLHSITAAGNGVVGVNIITGSQRMSGINNLEENPTALKVASGGNNLQGLNIVASTITSAKGIDIYTGAARNLYDVVFGNFGATPTHIRTNGGTGGAQIFLRTDPAPASLTMSLVGVEVFLQAIWNKADSGGVQTLNGSMFPATDNTIDSGDATHRWRFTFGNSATFNTTNSDVLVMTAKAFASLGTPGNGTFYFCNDCTLANPCAGAGTGALAKRLNGVWVCN